MATNGPVAPFDDLQIADDEGVVERDRAECLEPLSRLFHELDANLGDIHGCSPCDWQAPALRADQRQLRTANTAADALACKRRAMRRAWRA